MKDIKGEDRGLCTHEECKSSGDQCPEYYPPDEKALHIKCMFCDHLPRFHKKLSNSENDNASPTMSSINSENETAGESLSTMVSPNQPILPATSPPVAVPMQPFVPVPTTSAGSASINSIIPIYKYLPEFVSQFVLPLTIGKPECTKVGIKMQKALRHQITAFLDEHQLITDVSPQQAKKEYSLLRKELVQKWPKLITYNQIGEHTSKSDAIMDHVKFVKSISTNRKTQRLKKKKDDKKARDSDGTTSMELCYKELQSLTSNNIATSSRIDIPLYLRRTLALRLEVFPQELPVYLQSKENIFEEIQLRMGCSIAEMKKAITLLLDLYSKDQASRVVSLSEMEQYLHEEARAVDEKGSITKKMDDTYFLDIDDDFVYSDQDSYPRSGYCVKLKDSQLFLNDMKKYHHIEGCFSMKEATIIGFGSYFVFDRQYPTRYSQYLGLLEIIIKPPAVKTVFPKSERKSKLTDLLRRMNIK